MNVLLLAGWLAGPLAPAPVFEIGVEQNGRMPSWKKRRFERRKGLVNTAGPVWKASELGYVEAKGVLCVLSSCA